MIWQPRAAGASQSPEAPAFDARGCPKSLIEFRLGHCEAGDFRPRPEDRPFLVLVVGVVRRHNIKILQVLAAKGHAGDELRLFRLRRSRLLFP